ncbi:hypothetical protein KY321_02810, partial [Candidatus Woesearchaeota archaeon]|nr:hypothetical protein [Candidatus Woesearchaeota archaeon]
MVLNKKITRLILYTFFICFIVFWGYLSYQKKGDWAISIYVGENPYELTPHPDIKDNPVLTRNSVKDIPKGFVADPFMIESNNKWYMFFEVFNSLTGHADIGLASSDDALIWNYEHIVIDEPYHLSYPYVFSWEKSFYMIPEGRRGGAIKLYKAMSFPYEWKFIKNLVEGNYADASIVYFDNTWWMFALKGYEKLTLFYADSLKGEWIEHPKSPIIEDDKNIIRPGGRIVFHKNKMIRYVQDG